MLWRTAKKMVIDFYRGADQGDELMHHLVLEVYREICKMDDLGNDASYWGMSGGNNIEPLSHPLIP